MIILRLPMQVKWFQACKGWWFHASIEDILVFHLKMRQRFACLKIWFCESKPQFSKSFRKYLQQAELCKFTECSDPHLFHNGLDPHLHPDCFSNIARFAYTSHSSFNVIGQMPQLEYLWIRRIFWRKLKWTNCRFRLGCANLKHRKGKIGRRRAYSGSLALSSAISLSNSALALAMSLFFWMIAVQSLCSSEISFPASLCFRLLVTLTSSVSFFSDAVLASTLQSECETFNVFILLFALFIEDNPKNPNTSEGNRTMHSIFSFLHACVCFKGAIMIFLLNAQDSIAPLTLLFQLAIVSN